MKDFNVLLVLAALSVSAVSCLKEKEMRHEPGSGIRFSASTVWDNVPGTRTEYSGKTENDAPISASGFSLERIDWSGGVDQIRILCQAAGGDHAMGGHADDYLITGSETNAAIISSTPCIPPRAASLRTRSGLRIRRTTRRSRA